jgi:pimeloyl-ACP methyl ester carboxylesterase
VPGGAIREGTLGDGLAYLCLGAGPPLVYLPGLSSHHRLPQGMDRWFQVQQIRPFARHREVWWVQRRAGLTSRVTMADIAGDYAGAIGKQFGGPVDVLGVSTGGSVALQLAADNPEVVRRLVLVSSGCRLGPHGREVQRQIAAQLRRNKARRAGAALMSGLGTSAAAQRMMAGAGWLLGSSLVGSGDSDMLATIDAEDAFDLTGRLASITAPVLVAGGDRDAFYDGRVFEETAMLLPHGQLLLYRRKGHLGAVVNHRLAQDVLKFLDNAPDPRHA